MLLDHGTLRSYLERLRERGADEAIVRKALAAGATLNIEGNRTLLDTPVAFNTRLGTVAGRAFKRSIELNVELDLGCEVNEFLDTLLHEAAHVSAWEFERGHGSVWRSCCLVLGAKPQRCHQYATMQRRSR